MTEHVTLEAAPMAFSEEERRSERPARLLEAGSYPDKGLTLTEDDLDGIVARFAEGVPVKVEHRDSPLDPLGHVKRVWREGAALLGTLAFPDDLAAFLRRRGAAKLSVGLTRDPLALTEVSLVLKPRVASATLMEQEDVSAEVARLRAALRDQAVSADIATFKAQGRLVPASEDAARALLAAPEGATVTLADRPDSPLSVAETFRRFLAAQPPVVTLGEVALGAQGGGETGFSQYEHTFLSRLGADPAKVAALIRAERAGQTKGDTHAH